MLKVAPVVQRRNNVTDAPNPKESARGTQTGLSRQPLSIVAKVNAGRARRFHQHDRHYNSRSQQEPPAVGRRSPSAPHNACSRYMTLVHVFKSRQPEAVRTDTVQGAYTGRRAELYFKMSVPLFCLVLFCSTIEDGLWHTRRSMPKPAFRSHERNLRNLSQGLRNRKNRWVPDVSS